MCRVDPFKVFHLRVIFCFEKTYVKKRNDIYYLEPANFLSRWLFVAVIYLSIQNHITCILTSMPLLK